MVLVVPEHFGGLLALQSKSEACIENDACKFESIFGTAIKALDEQQGYSEEYDLIMPEFTVDTDVAVKKFLKYVSVLYFTIFIHLGLLEFYAKGLK